MFPSLSTFLPPCTATAQLVRDGNNATTLPLPRKAQREIGAEYPLGFAFSTFHFILFLILVPSPGCLISSNPLDIEGNKHQSYDKYFLRVRLQRTSPTNDMHPLQVMEREPLPPGGAPTHMLTGHNLAPKAEFRRGKSDDTFATNDDDGDDCSLVGAEMTLDVVDHDGDGNQSRHNSLPAMRASAEFANLHDLTTRSGEPDENEGGGDAENAKATSKEHERKWWWQKPSAEEAEEQARATVHNDDSDNCACARHGEDGEETTRDSEVVSRRRSLDHQPIMRRASIGGMFGLGLGLGPQQAHKEEEPEVDAEQAWANATWGDYSTRRASADNAMDKAAERLDRHQPPQQPVPEPRARRATMSFGIMGELPSQRGTYDTNPTQSQPQNNRRSSLGFGPTSLLRGISGAGSSEPNETSSEELEQKRRAMELEDQSLSDMLAMLKAQHNSGRAGTANKTCTNVANAVIVKEYMEVQRRASMSFTDTANSSSATSGTGAAGSDANLGGNDSRRQAMPKRTSMGFNILGGFGRNNQEQNEEEKEQSHYEDSYSTMTELKPVRPVPARSNSLRQMTARSSSLTGDGGFQGNTAEGIPSSRPPRTARRSSMH